jgi:hypothetical protein
MHKQDKSLWLAPPDGHAQCKKHSQKEEVQARKK